MKAEDPEHGSFLPPPQDSPVVVRPNRPQPAGPVRTAFAAVILLVAGIGLLLAFGNTVVASSDTGAPVAWLLPLGVHAAGVGALFALRRRLPERYRTWALRERLAPAPAEPPPAPEVPIDLQLEGTDGNRSVRLTIDGAGLRWRAPARRLAPAAELNVSWDELEGIAFGWRVGPTRLPGLVALGVAFGLFRWNVIVAAIAGAVALGLFALGGWRRRGTLTFVTATHVLQFQSTALDAEVLERVMAAARARRPKAAPPAGPPAAGIFRTLFGEAFEALVRGCSPDARVRARLVRDGARFVDEETASSAVIQWRLFGLWSGGLRGLGPVSWALGAGLATGSVLSAVVGWGVAWTAGTILVARTTRAFARFAGMELVQNAS